MDLSNYVRLQNAKGLGPKKIMSILAKLKEKSQDIDYLFGLSDETLVSDFGLSRPLAEALLATSIPTDIIEQMAQKEIRILAYYMDDYPQKIAKVLGKDAPPILYVWGNLELLSLPAVGFCGSRDASVKGMEVASDTACQIAERNWTVVSGHARGVDTFAHQAALSCGSGTVMVIPQGILDFKMRQELKKQAKSSQILIISEFSPSAHWSVGNAMTRNKTILSLSDAMILIESGLSGGTFEAGKAALKWNIPLFVVEYQVNGKNSEGNQFFVSKGANALRKSTKTNKANIATLVKTVNRKHKLETDNSADQNKKVGKKRLPTQSILPQLV